MYEKQSHFLALENHSKQLRRAGLFSVGPEILHGKILVSSTFFSGRETEAVQLLHLPVAHIAGCGGERHSDCGYRSLGHQKGTSLYIRPYKQEHALSVNYFDLHQ